MSKQARINSIVYNLGTASSGTNGTSSVIDFSIGDNLGVIVTPTQVGTTAITGTVVTQLQVSNDGTTYVNQGSSISTNAGTNFGLSYNMPAFRYGKLVVSGVTGGALAIKANVYLTELIN